MTRTTRTGGPGDSLPVRAVRAVRRVLAPAALELGGQVQALHAQVEALVVAVGVLEAENAALRDRCERLEHRVGDELGQLRDDLAELSGGLHEQRRLQLRVAEVTDLVTELVLPLHDREIDPAVLGRLRPDAL